MILRKSSEEINDVFLFHDVELGIRIYTIPNG
jgi:hypothetical protein